jgi:hypothetical protein
MGDQPIARPLPTQKKDTTEKSRYKYAYISRVRVQENDRVI